MTENAKRAWSEVGDKFSSFGRRVVDRFHETGSTGTKNADDAERELKRVLDELFDDIARGVSTVGATLKDDEAKKDLSDAVSALGDAISASVNEASEALRSRGSTPPPPPPPPPPTDG